MPAFQPGDTVVCIEPGTHLEKGCRYTVTAVNGGLVSLAGYRFSFYSRRFQKAERLGVTPGCTRIYPDGPAATLPHPHHHTRDAHPGCPTSRIEQFEAEIEGLKRQNKQYRKELFDLECLSKIDKSGHDALRRDIKRLEDRNRFLEYKLQSIKDIAS
jgi:hypothetical protein